MFRLRHTVLTRVTLATVLACVVPIAPAAAQTAPPARSTAPDLNLDHERFTLPNGLRVIVHQDRKAPVVAVSVWYHVGSKNEPRGQDRLRAPVRAPDVQRLRELQRRMVRAAAARGRHRA